MFSRLRILALLAAGLSASPPPHVDVFRAGDNGYASYRIPALIVSPKGTLLAFCEGRRNSASDTGDIDVLLRRSFDNGKSWQPVQTIADMDSRSIFNLVRDEQPQTIAFVVSHLTPEKAAQIFALIPDEQRDQIIERLATLAPTPIEVTERVVNVLNAKMGVKQTRALSQTGGVTPAADILNAMDKTVSRALLTSIEERNPELSQAIRKKMFTFEDLLLLNSQVIQRIMRETEMRDLALALKKASEPLKKLLLSNISRRGAESVQDEMLALGHVKLRDVEAAQLRIIDAVRKLEAEGEIDLDEARNAEYEVV